MKLDWKKIGIVVLFLAALALFAFFIYWFFLKPIFSDNSTQTTTSTSTTTTGQLPQSSTTGQKFNNLTNRGQLPDNQNQNQAGSTSIATIANNNISSQTKLLTSDNTFYPTTAKNGNVIYYNKTDGKFYQVDSSGKVSQYGSKVFNDVSNVTWSNSLNKAVLEYPDGSKIIYDFDENKQYSIPSHWQDFSFSPNDQQIAFKSIALDPENRFLVVANSNGSNPQSIENIGGVEDKFAVGWSPNNQMVATFQDGKDLDRNEIYFIGLNNENFKSMIVEGHDFQGQWSPSGDRMLYSVYNSQNDYKPQLWISYAYGQNIGDGRQSIGLQTWSSKCLFSDAVTVYCGVPTDLPTGAALSPDIADTIPDQIYKINLTTGNKELVAIPDSSQTVKQILSVSNGYLNFVTPYNSTYQIKVK